ncbi:predicted protein [Histoplasma mississippiense (nom. inval.)]|uniref:predicted protein n=1 Tax=Ajellomyces capsulatus (strain NAm1 / WU24) TaxID=2059318 RepID=UPI000157C49B|nr:predicted protein [Histoplasma mississippiense (nom. inval.)]EDN08932.1 predicted protein [Histoplasma mississippiense (nom. inval.)]
MGAPRFPVSTPSFRILEYTNSQCYKVPRKQPFNRPAVMQYVVYTLPRYYYVQQQWNEVGLETKNLFIQQSEAFTESLLKIIFQQLCSAENKF